MLFCENGEIAVKYLVAGLIVLFKIILKIYNMLIEKIQWYSQNSFFDSYQLKNTLARDFLSNCSICQKYNFLPNNHNG